MAWPASARRHTSRRPEDVEAETVAPAIPVDHRASTRESNRPEAEAEDSEGSGHHPVRTLRALDLLPMWACTSIIAIFTFLPLGSAAFFLMY